MIGKELRSSHFHPSNKKIIHGQTENIDLLIPFEIQVEGQIFTLKFRNIGSSTEPQPKPNYLKQRPLGMPVET